jgi:hypothetical protein
MPANLIFHKPKPHQPHPFTSHEKRPKQRPASGDGEHKTMNTPQDTFEPLLARDGYPPYVQVHPICRLPKGYRWAKPFEVIGPGCKFTRKTSPKWLNVHPQSRRVAYDPKAYCATAVPIEDNTDSATAG